ncbi:NUDIX hydrolase [Planococcus sp. YIM B11945]|uniref:NUDIX hydrolase n=1 Tax=Planococcus sp. YIM B11945 TaxID=3435410 RepID=UPI003D7E7D2D
MELWDVVDENRKPIGKLHTRGVALPSGEFHIVVEIFTINQDGSILLTQRDPLKTHPLLWETTGGSLTAGETSAIGALRELEEETGLKAAEEELIKLGEQKINSYFRDSYIWKSSRLFTSADLSLQSGEVCDAKFVSFAEFEQMHAEGLMIPSLWERYKQYQNEIEHIIGIAEKRV